MVHDILRKLVSGQAFNLQLNTEYAHIILIMLIRILQTFFYTFQFSKAALEGNNVHQSGMLVNAQLRNSVGADKLAVIPGESHTSKIKSKAFADGLRM